MKHSIMNPQRHHRRIAAEKLLDGIENTTTRGQVLRQAARITSAYHLALDDYMRIKDQGMAKLEGMQR